MAQHDSDKSQWHRDKDHEWQAERAELGDDQQIDPENRDREGSAHVAESDIGHFPFAVPQQRWLRLIKWLTVIVNVRRSAFSPIHFLDLILDREHPVNGRLKSPGYLRLHHFGEAAIAAEKAVGGRFSFHGDNVTELHILALACGASGGQRRRENALAHPLSALRQLDVNLDRFRAIATLRVADLHPADDGSDRVINGLFIDAIE